MSTLLKSFAVLILTVTSSAAFAGTPIKCVSTGAFSFIGSVPAEDEAGTDGVLTLKSESGREKFAMVCAPPLAAGGPSGPDTFAPVMYCNVTQDFNTGYSVEVKQGGIAGITMAVVKKANNRALPTTVASLLCRY